jgi:hypothetical protein
MADTSLTMALGLPQRKDVTLPSAGDAIPSVSARPVSVALPGMAGVDTTAAQTLMRSLGVASDTLSGIGKDVLKEQRAEEFKRGQLAQQENQEKFADAQAKGVIPQAANPWFVKGYQNQDGRVQGLDYYTQIRAAYDKSPAKGSDDPAVYQQFVQDFTKQYMGGLGTDKPTDWWDGYNDVAANSQQRLAHEHAQLATEAAVAKQATNTGAELNIILNSAKDPKAAGEAINELAKKMRLEGMTDEAFQKVTGEAIIAKAKLGDPKFLSTLDYVKAGGADSAATLASNPRIAMAKADTEQWLIQKSRSAQEFAWSADNHDYQVNVVRPRAEEAYKHEQETWNRQSALWTRQDKSRSLTTQVQTAIFADPENSKANTKELLTKLNDVDPEAARSASQFQDAYLTRSEHVPANEEAPVIAKLNEDMIQAAGNPERQRQLMLDANDAFTKHKINRDTATNFLLDAQRFATFDPTISRKLQAPELNKVKDAAKGLLVDKKNNPMGILTGTAQVDYLNIERSINTAARKYLEAKPDATPDELAAEGTKALETAARALGKGSGVSGGSLGELDDLGRTATGAYTRGQQQGNNALDPSNPNVKPADMSIQPIMDPVAAAQHLSPETRQAFLKAASEAYAKGGTALLDLINEYDAKLHIPGVGRAIIQGSKPKQ